MCFSKSLFANLVSLKSARVAAEPPPSAAGLAPAVLAYSLGAEPAIGEKLNFYLRPCNIKCFGFILAELGRSVLHVKMSNLQISSKTCRIFLFVNYPLFTTCIVSYRVSLLTVSLSFGIASEHQDWSGYSTEERHLLAQAWHVRILGFFYKKNL